MPWYIVDTRDRLAQQVTADAKAPEDPRFVNIFANSASEAIRAACDRSLQQTISNFINWLATHIDEIAELNGKYPEDVMDAIDALSALLPEEKNDGTR